MSLAERVKILSQLFLNEELTPDLADRLKRKLEKMKRLGLEALMIWSKDTDNLGRLASICAREGVSQYLWYPMLADTPARFEAKDFQVVAAVESGRSQILEAQKAGGEEFAFLCPNRVGGEERFLELFEETLDLADFAGVFFDRIRFPSPANGLKEILTCVCDDCLERSGGVIESLRGDLQRLLKEPGKAVGVEAMPGILRELFASIEEAIVFRTTSVSALLADYARAARKRNLDIGIDLFPPSLAKLVGQDYTELSRHVDWIKPMIYCKTMGPAGLPMELLSLAKILRELNGNISERDSLWVLEQLTGLDLPESFGELASKGLTLDNYDRELEKLESLDRGGAVRIYPGFEAVAFPPVCSVDPAIVGEYVRRTLNRGYRGFTLSWDIRQIPPANLEAVGDFLAGW